MIQRISGLSSYAVLAIIPSNVLFSFYFSRSIAGYQVTILDVILWVAFATFAMDLCANKRPLLQHAMDKWMLFLFGICMIFFIIGVLNKNDKVLVWGLRSIWTLLLLYFPLAHHIGFDCERKKRLIKFILIYTTIVGFAVIPLRFGLLSAVVNPVSQASILPEMPGATPAYGDRYRLTWVLHRATYSIIALNFCFAAFLLGGKLLRLTGGKIGWLACVGANMLVMLFAKSRGAILLSVCTIALCGALLWFYTKARLRTSGRIAMFLIVVLSALVVFVSFLEADLVYFGERIFNIGPADRTIHARILTIQKDLEGFQESPIIGKGLGFSNWYYYRTDMMWRKTYGEIGITRMLTWFGLLGTSIVYVFLVWLLLKSIGLLKHPGSPLNRLIGAVCAAQLVAMMAMGYVFDEYTVLLILIAVLLRSAGNESDILSSHGKAPVSGVGGNTREPGGESTIVR